MTLYALELHAGMHSVIDGHGLYAMVQIAASPYTAQQLHSTQSSCVHTP